MGLFNDLFGRKEEKEKKIEEHSVIVQFTYYKEDLAPLHRLEEQLEKVVNKTGVGEYDGHEIAVDLSDGALFMYGPNAENLFKAVKPILEQTDFTKGAIATLMFGGHGSGAKEIEIQIEK